MPPATASPHFPLHGNLLVVHGGGPTAVLNASLYGVIQEAFQHPEVEGAYGARFGTEGLLDQDLIDLRREPAATIEALRQTPGSALGSSRRRIEPGDYERILENLRARNIRFLFFNGGNGSMLAAAQLARLAGERAYELRVMGIPKTVDNDLVRTDHCPGYGSAARYLAVSALELGRDNEALPFPVEILETMGRNAGWLAAATVLAAREPEDGPQLVYVPEVPFDSGQFLQDVERVYRRMGRVVVAVAEGIKDARGEPVLYSSQETDRDGFGRPLTGNVSVELARLVGRELRLRVRNDKPGLCGRASAAHVSSVDRDEAQQCGEFAVRQALAGATGMMVTLERISNAPYRCGLGLAPLEEIACRERPLPGEFMNAEGNYPSRLFLEYAAPLAGPGLPAYTRLTATRTSQAPARQLGS